MYVFKRETPLRQLSYVFLVGGEIKSERERAISFHDVSHIKTNRERARQKLIERRVYMHLQPTLGCRCTSTGRCLCATDITSTTHWHS